jgi:hypothetical protein
MSGETDLINESGRVTYFESFVLHREKGVKRRSFRLGNHRHRADAGISSSLA